MGGVSYEWGGPDRGPAVVLLPGAGRTVADWAQVAQLLTDRYRVVAMELPVDGDAWSWRSALDDLAAVVNRHDLTAPAVVGHSLGGIVAGMWATEHAECPAAVNLDGHGPATAARLRGVSSATVEEWRVALDALADTELQQAAPGLLSALRSVELPLLWQRARCPLLVIHATAAPELPAALLELLPWYAEMSAADARGLRAGLASVAEHNPYVSVREIDAAHMVLVDEPTLTAELVGEFLDQQVQTSPLPVAASSATAEP